MNQHCIYCNKPRYPRKDRPGKFFTMCHEHHKAYMREKNRESYARNIEERRKNARQKYWDDPEKARAIVAKSIASSPERHARKKAYMRLYNSPYRMHCKDACELCGYQTRDPEFKRDLDVHHIDNNHQNNDPNNLQTLCPPCHRLL